MAKVLLAGESWISTTTEYKGFDQFSFTQLHIGCDAFLQAMTNGPHEITHLRAHDVPIDFPNTLEALAQYDVVILSDIGANSLLLPPQVFTQGQTSTNRLQLLVDWVLSGGSLLMAGGYLSFGGFEGKAKYYHTVLEEILPVNIFAGDDRIELPQGINAKVTTEHHIVSGLDKTWPALLGYQITTPKPEAQIIATIDNNPLLVIAEYGKGRSAAFTSDIAPHWAPEQFLQWSGYQLLFTQLISWLAQEG